MTHTPCPTAPSFDAAATLPAAACMLDHARLAALALLVRCSLNSLVDELLPMFTADVGENLDRLRAARAGRLWPDVCKAAHAIGSVALDIGALRLGGLCRQLESICRQGGGGSDDLFAAIEACFAETCTMLAAARR